MCNYLLHSASVQRIMLIPVGHGFNCIPYLAHILTLISTCTYQPESTVFNSFANESCFCSLSSPFTVVHYGSLYDYLALLATLHVPLNTSFQPPLGEQCLVHTVHTSWEKSGCEARELVSFY